jgi:hypothetical protein
VVSFILLLVARDARASVGGGVVSERAGFVLQDDIIANFLPGSRPPIAVKRGTEHSSVNAREAGWIVRHS